MFAVREHRFARGHNHRCTGCVRWIDEEDYTRDFIVEYGTVTILKFCRDCVRLAA